MRNNRSIHHIHQLDTEVSFQQRDGVHRTIPVRAGQSDQDAIDAWSRARRIDAIGEQQLQKENEMATKPKKKPAPTLDKRLAALESDVSDLQGIEAKLDALTDKLTEIEPKLVTDGDIRQRVNIIADKVGTKTTLRDEVERFSSSVHQKFDGLNTRIADVDTARVHAENALGGRLTNVNQALGSTNGKVAALEKQRLMADARANDLESAISRLRRDSDSRQNGIEARARSQDATNTTISTRLESVAQQLTTRLSMLENKLDTIARAKLEILERLAKLEESKAVLVPMYTRENGKSVRIADMNDAHLKNAIIKALRGEKDLDALVFRNLCVEAEKRSMPWQTWTTQTEPVTKFATKNE